MQPTRMPPVASETAQQERTNPVNATKPNSRRLTIAEEKIGSFSSTAYDKKEKSKQKTAKKYQSETSAKVEVAKDAILPAKSRAEVDSSPRSSSSGSKSDISPRFDLSTHDPLADYSEEYLAKLNPQARMALLKHCRERLDIDQNARTICSRIEKINKDMMNTRLLDAIIKDDKLRLAICLDNTPLIETEELFAAIKNAVYSMDPQDAERNRKLIAFCMEWISENRGTKRLEQTLPIFNEIVSLFKRTISDKSRSEDKALLSGFTAIVDKGLKPVPKSAFVSPFASESDCDHSIEQILKQIKTSELTTNDVEDRFAAKVAKDLHGHQALIFLDLAPRDFVKKYKEMPESLQRSIRFYNALSDYVAETVVNCIVLIERLRVMRFFLLIAKNSKQLGDFQSLAAICAGLCGDITVTRLKNSWLKLKEKSEAMKELVAEIESLADMANNQKNLREAQSAHSDPMKVIPFLSFIQKKLTKYDDMGMKVVEGANGPEYNLNRALDGRALILDALATQGKVRPQNGLTRPFCNIVFVCLRNFPTTKEECEERINARLERSKQLEPPNPIVP